MSAIELIEKQNKIKSEINIQKQYMVFINFKEAQIKKIEGKEIYSVSSFLVIKNNQS